MTGASSVAELISALEPPRAVWVMVPAGEITERAVAELGTLLEPGDTVIDGGNTHYHDDIRRARKLADRGIHYIDVGTSGGVFGLERGFCLMVGGDEQAVERLAPLFASLASGLDAAERTAGRAGDPAPEELGWLHCGPAGAGHFVKMVHNGIEYGLMAAYAEGLNLIHHANVGAVDRESDAETAPLDRPEHYAYDLDVAAITEVWRRGSVVASWLLDLTAAALHASPSLDEFGGRVSDSGEGRWTSIAAIETECPRPSSPPRCSSGSRHAARPTSRTACSPRCARSSAATPRSPRRRTPSGMTLRRRGASGACDARTQGAAICRHIGATEDEAACRPTRFGGSRLHTASSSEAPRQARIRSSGLSSSGLVAPDSAIVNSSSARTQRSTWRTPASPARPRP